MLYLYIYFTLTFYYINLYKRQTNERHDNEIKEKIENRQMKEDWISRQTIKKKLEQSNKWKKIE